MAGLRPRRHQFFGPVGRDACAGARQFPHPDVDAVLEVPADLVWRA